MVAPLIELKKIRKCYGGQNGVPETEILHGLDVQIYAGEFVAIVGQSGSGKSTLMNIIGCLDRPTSGEYLFNGTPIAELNADALAWLRRQAFGFVFQGYHLIHSETAQENVEMPAIYAGLASQQRAIKAQALLERLGLQEKYANRPHQLSGGQQQRVSISRSLINGGHIILADEPTGALDSQSGKQVMALLHELADAGHTIILITHDQQIAQQARRVIEIKDGYITRDSGAQITSKTQANPAAQINPKQIIEPTIKRLDQLREALRSAWRGMKVNRSRTLLTLLGIIIGVASVIVMMAVGEGARQKVIAQMGTMGTRIIYMNSDVPLTGGAGGILSEEDLQAVNDLPEIAKVMPIIGDPLTVRYGNVARSAYVLASSEEMPEIHHWPVGTGRFFSAQEDQTLAPVVVLGAKLKEQFFPDMNPLGQQLLIEQASFEVIGVMSERGADSGAQDYDGMVFIPYQSGKSRVYQGVIQPDYVTMEAASIEVIDQAEQRIRELLTQRHAGREDFSIGNAAARLKAEAKTRQNMTMMLALIAAVSLLVGGIGVMNVMLMTVKERTKEIGIRIATGARRADILRLFITEAVLLSAVGGAIGLFIGVSLGVLLMAAGVAVVFSLSAMLGALTCSFITGIVFGFMPARTAARLDPVVALAGE